MGKQIRVKYANKVMPRLKTISKGDWIDLPVFDVGICDMEDVYETQQIVKNKIFRPWYFDETIGKRILEYNTGDVVVVNTGICMELPNGYEAELKARSSTFLKYGLVQTNAVGLIDESYKGDNDEWLIVFVAFREGVIHQYDRVAQFRINEKMPKIEFVEVESLENEDRGGYGSTGKQEFICKGCAF